MRHSFALLSLFLTLASPSSAKPQFVEQDAAAVHVLHGEGPHQFGYEAANAGDVDGDGICDFVVGAPNWSKRSGRFYVYSGATAELLYHHDGDRPGSQLGWSVAGAGDVDADGTSDVVVGEPRHLDVGRVRVFAPSEGAVLREWKGESAGDLFGDEVETVGDWNGDGHADVVVGASMFDAGRGKAYVFSGSDGALLASFEGESGGDRFGSSVCGHADGTHRMLVVGAPQAGAGGRGRVYVFGADGRLSFSFDAESTGVDLGSHFVSVIGDVDGDGRADVYASDWKDGAKGSTTGRIYLHSGKDGSRLWTLAGSSGGDGFGIGNARAGDVNGDGRADLIVGSWIASGVAPRAGKTSLLSGADGALLRQWTCNQEGATFGYDATGLGDVNDDGSIDFLVSGADANSSRGTVWVLAGAPLESDASGEAPSPPQVAGVGDPQELQRAQDLVRQKKPAQAVPILRTITDNEPTNARAWYLLGYSLHAKGDLDEALVAHAKAAEFPSTRAASCYNAACAWSLKGDKERSFEWLRKAVEAGFNNTNLLQTDPELKNVRKDVRFTEFLPKEIDPAQPFREETRILHEWSGESKGDQFGWEATRLGDLDADGVSDVIVSAPFLQIGGTQVGRIYLYSAKTGDLIREHTGGEAAQLGMGIAPAGDVDGDGQPDYMAGAPGAKQSRGSATVWSGRTGTEILSASGETDGDRFGENVWSLGDVNDDGHGDIAVAAPQYDGVGPGLGPRVRSLGQTGRAAVPSRRPARRRSVRQRSGRQRRRPAPHAGGRSHERGRGKSRHRIRLPPPCRRGTRTFLRDTPR